MKRIVTLLSGVLLLACPLLAQASTWTIDPEHSNIGFKVKHLMISYVKGSFDKHTGRVEIDDRDITKSRVEISIDTSSVNTSVQKRDEHLRSADFFDVAKYPTITFVSKRITRAGKDTLEVSGDLTIRGVTREVVLAVDGPTQESRDPWGNVRKGAAATTRINRKDFGLTWNKALETGGVVVGDEVLITLEVEMIKVK